MAAMSKLPAVGVPVRVTESVCDPALPVALFVDERTKLAAADALSTGVMTCAIIPAIQQERAIVPSFFSVEVYIDKKERNTFLFILPILRSMTLLFSLYFFFFFVLIFSSS